jgi:hypothetical protein
MFISLEVKASLDLFFECKKRFAPNDEVRKAVPRRERDKVKKAPYSGAVYVSVYVGCV